MHTPSGISPSKFIHKKKYKALYCFNNSLDFCIFLFRKFPKIPDTEDYKTKHSVLSFHFTFDFTMKLQTVLFLVTMLGMSLTLIEVEGNLGDKAIPAKGNAELVI